MAARKKKKTSLTDKELQRIDKHHATISMEKLELKYIQLEAKNLQLSYQLSMNDLNKRIEKKSSDTEARIKAHTAYMKNLSDLCGIDGKWSFNPETGEIIKED